jgi:bifunctional non-homologous end joining protein LigD
MPKASQPASPLHAYWAKRDFSRTAEPRGEALQSEGRLSFVIQKHVARSLHYDFRLELGGVLLSWAVPKGPSLDPSIKRLAIQTEDHPLAYALFEGTIPSGQYGAGSVIVWDRGTWEPLHDPTAGLAAGKLPFVLHGQKLRGAWELIRTAKQGSGKAAWLLFKKRDAHARRADDFDVVTTVPDSLSPQLATLAACVPSVGIWRYEVKFDGYRLLARVDGSDVKLLTRGGHDWTAKMPTVVACLKRFGLTSAWLDGEVVVQGDDGTPDFSRLQRAFDGQGHEALSYFVFDILFSQGNDVRALPWSERRSLLVTLLADRHEGAVRLSAEFEGDAAGILAAACRMGLEGIIAKRADAPYVGRRSDSWLKLKCQHRQEFVVIGFTDRGGDNRQGQEVGALMLAIHDEAGQWVPVGKVGTGWDARAARDLRQRLARMTACATPPGGAVRPKRPKRPRWASGVENSVHWLAKPSLVVEVRFSGWTADGQIRHASFAGIQTDKKASGVRREDAELDITHPDRVIDPITGLTKLDLFRYYAGVAEWMLPHLRGRPCSLVRAPSGIGGELFFQKHADHLQMPGVLELDAGLWPGHAAMLEVPTKTALLSAAQMNVVEFHTWNAGKRRIGEPDRVVFDLDPGEGVEWSFIQEAATLTKSLLADLGLTSWLKTSGGKGLHVVVPIAPRHDWGTVKAFAMAVSQHMAKTIPSRFVAKSGPSNRVGKIYVDYLRNSQGATTVSAFSARARPGLGVSMPVDWTELAHLKGADHFTLATAIDYLSTRAADPWADYGREKQRLTGAMANLAISSVHR